MLLMLPSRQNSTLKDLKETYDNKNNENVIWIEYRVRDGPRLIVDSNVWS